MLYVLVALLAVAYGVVIDRPSGLGRRKYKEIGKTDGSKPITLSFHLKNQNVGVLHDVLMAVSTPGNPKYGQFLTQEEVQTLVAPRRESVETVTSWLQRFGFDVRSASLNDEVLKVETTIAKAEELLQTEYYDYEMEDDATFVVYRVKQGSNYEVPSNIASHVNLVTPTLRLPQPKQVIPGVVGAGAITPSVLKELYNVGDVEGSAVNNTQAICSFQRQYYSKSDLTTFWGDYKIDSCTVIDVPSDTPSGEKLEAELDTQYISSMGEKITMQVWYNSGDFEDALLTWTNNAMNDPNCPLIFSVSYGATESYYGGAYIDQLNTQMMQLGATGVSIFFASGDSGAGGGCVNSQAYAPDYPASSPYVTAVGGVTGGTAGKTPPGESCWVDGGGGFSNYAETQSWQSDAVSYYLNNANGLPDSRDYNSSGRGFPDISAQSVDFIIVVNGRQEGVSGTSCSSPSAAGIFALLNDLRLQNNMAQLGFANPWIYQTAGADSTAFGDVTEGYNEGCGISKGFPAQPHWDACSGYGSPNYGVLATHVMDTGVPQRKL